MLVVCLVHQRDASTEISVNTLTGPEMGLLRQLFQHNAEGPGMRLLHQLPQHNAEGPGMKLLRQLPQHTAEGPGMRLLCQLLKLNLRPPLPSAPKLLR